MEIIVGRCDINRWFLLLLLASMLEDSESFRCSKDLLNQVVNEGESAAFYGAVNSSANFWQFIPYSDPLNRPIDITERGSMYSRYDGIYVVESSILSIITASGNPVTNDSYPTAGIYVLTYQDIRCRTEAHLITILNGGPMCNCDRINQLVNCTITYAESTFEPCYAGMTWTDSNNNRYSIDTQTPVRITNRYTSVSKLPITNVSASEYTCQVTFDVPRSDAFSDMGWNAPTYTASCSIANCLKMTTTTPAIAATNGTTATTTTTTQSTTTPTHTTTIPTPTTIKTTQTTTKTTQTTTKTTQTTTSVVPTSTTIYAQSIQIQPTYGPVAGGTVVIIACNWLDKNAFISAVYIGENHRASNYSKSGNNVLVKTPKIDNEQLIDQQLPIVLEISPGPHNISTGQFFTYKPNPGVEDVNPKVLNVNGGIRLNITGHSLTSVVQPLIRAAAIIWSVNGSTTSNNETFGPCYPPTENGTQMVCVSPPIYIRDDFLHQLFGEADPYSKSRKKRQVIIDSDLWQIRFNRFQQTGTSLTMKSKRSELPSISTNQTYISENGLETMRICLGIVFDGYERYKETILLDSTGDFKVTNPPTISISCKGDIQFDPSKGDDAVITIKGDKMRQCCQMIDYTVRIGDGFCNITSLTDNALTCSPPKVKPQQTDIDRLYCGKDFVIFVDLGNGTYNCSCLSYSDESATTFIIVAATVGSSLLIIISIFAFFIIIRKTRKPKTTLHELYTDDRRKNMKMSSRLPKNIRNMNFTEQSSAVSYGNQISNKQANPNSYQSTDEVYSRQPMSGFHARLMGPSFYSRIVYSNSAASNNY